MASVVISNFASKVSPELKKKAFSLLMKLNEDDSAGGLHIEPVRSARDPRVRTARLDQSNRAVLFKLDGPSGTVYVLDGIWQHDEAYRKARISEMRVNPVNGVTEIRRVEGGAAAAGPAEQPASPAAPNAGDGGPAAGAAGAERSPAVGEAATPGPSGKAAAPSEPPLLETFGVSRADLVDQIGIEPALAERALRVRSEDQAMEVADGDGVVEWQGQALLDLFTGEGVDAVRAKLGLKHEVPHKASEDANLLEGLRHPAAQMTYSYADGEDDLRRAIDQENFGAWRVFLHPEQRRYATGRWKGSFRLSGGAGTGKTVVLIHRARNLARQEPSSRIILTTFTRNLADNLDVELRELDSGIDHSKRVGEPGVYVAGIDALANRVLRALPQDAVLAAAEQVLGPGWGGVRPSGDGSRWREAVEQAGADLPQRLRSPAFLQAEYTQIVLPNHITDQRGYLRARRPGRGVALDRRKRLAVWQAIEAFRADGRVRGTVTFDELAAVAAVALQASGPVADHVLADECQDLTPARFQFLRALAAEGPDDLFIAEDSQQRIYGPKVVLSHYGISIRGRSRRMTLNYRTTKQNLEFALRILGGEQYTDLEGEAASSSGYRSVRSGPAPRVLRVGGGKAGGAGGTGGAGRAGSSPLYDAVADTLRAWLRDPKVASEPETVAVLVRAGWQRDALASALAERGVDVRAVDREHIRGGKPVVMTMYRAKGTEFSRVLLLDPQGAGAGPGSGPREVPEDEQYSEQSAEDARQRERSLVYVAATRARDELVTVEG